MYVDSEPFVTNVQPKILACILLHNGLEQVNVGCSKRNLAFAGASGRNAALPPAFGHRERNPTWTVGSNVYEDITRLVFTLIPGVTRNNTACKQFRFLHEVVDGQG